MVVDESTCANESKAISKFQNALQNFLNNERHESQCMGEGSGNHASIPNTFAKHRQSYTHALYKIWHRSYLDMKELGQKKLCLTQKDILSLFHAKNKEPKAEFYVVPRIPSKQVSLENALLINKTQKRYLLALWRLTRNEEDYVDYIEAIASQS
jgi:hypothetical protein